MVHGWSGRRVAAVFLLATLCAQAAWIVAVPPLRGMDEFDHAFRAAGVAAGQWRLDQSAAGGRGLLVAVPEELVEVSLPQCERLPYIESDTCDGDGPGSKEGTVLATTSAANYLPAYYWVVGTAGEPFSGAASVYAMRAASALLCGLVLAIAVACLTTWARGPWAYVGLLVGLTPTLLYSTSVIAPNGLEMAAGACLWAALLGLRPDAAPDATSLRRERWLLAAAGLSVVLLAGLRTLGPLWVALIVLAVALLRGPRGSLRILARHRWPAALVAGAGLAVCGAVLAWNAGNVPIADGALNADNDSSWSQVVRWPTWVLQSIGAFPFRDQPAPLVVHLLVLIVMATLVVAAVRRRAGAGRTAVAVSALLCLAVPSALVALTLEDRGGAWQGRYSLPFAVGVALLAGLVLDRVRWQTRGRDVRPQLLAASMLVLAHVVSVVHVQRAELASATTTSGWAHPPVVVTGLLMALGWAALALVVVAARADVVTEIAEDERTVTEVGP